MHVLMSSTLAPWMPLPCSFSNPSLCLYVPEKEKEANWHVLNSSSENSTTLMMNNTPAADDLQKRAYYTHFDFQHSSIPMLYGRSFDYEGRYEGRNALKFG